MRTPRDIKVSMFACVALFAHMTRFIAGASTIGASVATHSVARQVIRAAARQARDEIRARRRDQHELGPTGEFDVTHGGLGARCPTDRCASAGPKPPGSSWA